MKLRRGWFRKAKAKWIRERLYSWDWYGGDAVEICAWVEWRRGRVIRYSPGFCISNTQRQALDAVMVADFFEVRRLCRVTGSHMHFHKREKFASNAEHEPRREAT